MIEKMIKNFLTQTKNVNRSAVFWNAFSAMMNSFQTMLLLMIITRFGDMTDSSIFVIAYAIGNLMLNVGKYGIRQYQVTDVNELYNWKDYQQARKVSVMLMLAGSVGYILINCINSGYTLEKASVVALVCFMKAIEAYEDVYHGRMQQKGRLDIAGKILGIRLFIFLIGFILVYILTKNLVVTCIINVIITLVLCILFNRSVFGMFVEEKAETYRSSRLKLMQECFPLCVCMCLNMYIANAPKYIIDTIVSDEVQTCFNIVFMPVFVIALLANFIFQPFLKKMGELWNERIYKKFIVNIFKLAIVVVVSSIVIIFVGNLIGIQVLGFVYGVDLSDYRKLLLIYMISGGIVALQNLMIMVLTTVRYQKYMIYGYIVTALVLLVFGSSVLEKFGVVGLSSFFMIMMLLLLIYCILLIVVSIRKAEKVKG